MSMHRNAFLLVPALALSLQVFAHEALPVAQDHNGIRVLTGGVTIDESTAVKSMAGPYRLRLVLATRTGAYQIATNFRIMQGSRTLVSLDEAGPWVLVDLPPGRYQLSAEVAGERLEKQLVLGQRAGTVHWITPAHLD